MNIQLINQQTLSNPWVLSLGVFVLCLLSYWLSSKILLGVISFVIRKTETKIDDILLTHKVFNRLASLVPAFILWSLSPALPASHAFSRIALALICLSCILSLDALLNSLHDIYKTLDSSSGKPIKGYLQLVKILLFSLGGIVIIATLLGKSPFILLSGIGAMTAVLLLVFRDTILSLVASVQIGTYGILKIDDWIEMPEYGADGDVIDINLHTIRVQNWDKTISSIPTHKFLDHSFKNWRGMEQAGGRRIKRSIVIDLGSIKFCPKELLEKLKGMGHLSQYIENKQQEIDKHNQNLNQDMNILTNGRRITNIGSLRAYLESYLRNHPQIHDDMTCMVRQLKPTDKGLPLELYCFCKDTRWTQFEAIQGDIFDHILAVVPEFELKLFQIPSGADLQGLGKAS